MSDVNVRKLIVETLNYNHNSNASVHFWIKLTLENYQYLDKRDRAFFTRVVEGTVEHEMEIDYILNYFSKTPVKRMDKEVRNILRMSVYQIKYMDSVPDSAAVNEAVKLIKKGKYKHLQGFVNGVLRNIVRNIDNMDYPDEKLKPYDYLEVKYSMPRWITGHWITEYGYEKTREICMAFYQERPNTIRHNTSKCTKEELIASLEQEGIVVTPVEGMDYVFEISGYDHIAAIDAFQKGWFYVQDTSSMMVTEIADPKLGDYVVDVCAAPGGKSCHMADRLNGTGMVDSRDVSEDKVALIQQNMDRQGFTNMTVKVQDAMELDESVVNKADILICDVPCSGLGVMGKKVDIRYHMNQEDQQMLVALQRKIVDTCCAYVKEGGTLIYSTCTIHKDENEGNVAWFLQEHPQFELVSQEQMFPGTKYHDGFFIAKLKRVR